MSHWVYLRKDGDAVQVDHHEEGGTYALGGISTAELNITYNYSHLYSLALTDQESEELSDKGLIRWLEGKTAGETVPVLELVVMRLGDKRYQPEMDGSTGLDYWAPTPGNAGYAANILLEWAKQHPDAVWDVS